jgi:hypothetical protein
MRSYIAARLLGPSSWPSEPKCTDSTSRVPCSPSHVGVGARASTGVVDMLMHRGGANPSRCAAARRHGSTRDDVGDCSQTSVIRLSRSWDATSTIASVVPLARRSPRTVPTVISR